MISGAASASELLPSVYFIGQNIDYLTYRTHMHTHTITPTAGLRESRWSAGCNEAAFPFIHTGLLSFLGAAFWCFRLSFSFCTVQGPFCFAPQTQ